jgi:uncharacterized protein YjiS (DUF1127 family)
MLRKHARDRVFLIKMIREKSMPLTKPLFDAKPPFPRLHEIDQSTPRRTGFKHDDTPRDLSQVGSAPQPMMPAAAAVKSRLMFTVISWSVESVLVVLFAIASWLVAEALAGFAAYAMAMYPTPAAMDNPSKPGDPKLSTSTDMEHGSERYARLLPSEPTRIHADTWGPADDTAQPMHTAGTLSNWCAVINAPAIVLLSKFRRARARQQAVAELESLDDRSLRDIGISRGEIQNVTRY